MSAHTSTPSSVLDIPVERIDGSPTSLAEHRGKVLLIVNVASQCGFTPQYAGLEELYEANREKGFVICGFPAKDSILLRGEFWGEVSDVFKDRGHWRGEASSV
jgi:glutathione peroxidase-family protein